MWQLICLMVIIILFMKPVHYSCAFTWDERIWLNKL